jgi:sarcosine oxidase
LNFDVIVIGTGAMGSAAAFHLARRGKRVLALDRYVTSHEFGSSHGLTRIIRLAYFEHPDYVPMLKAAWELWPRIEADAGVDRLIQVTGGLYVGQKGSAVLEGSLRSAREHGLDHELMDAGEARARFPALRLDDDMDALHEPLAGILFPDKCISAQLELAERYGAELHFNERVSGWSSDGEGIAVITDVGTYRADKIVVAAGAWLPKLAPELHLPLTVERNVLFWFDPVAEPQVHEADSLPVWIMELDDEHAFYGFPSLPGQGVKVARHHGGTPVDPDQISREATAHDEQQVRDFMARHMPNANGRRLDARVCMYTNTPDYNFILDFHPDDERILIASPCSGHGFKFSNVIGSIAADLVLEGRTSFEIDFISIDRFG